MKTSGSEPWQRVRSWVQMTPQERLLMAGILAIFLIGLLARWYHLHHADPAPCAPPEAGPVSTR